MLVLASKILDSRSNADSRSVVTVVHVELEEGGDIMALEPVCSVAATGGEE